MIIVPLFVAIILGFAFSAGEVAIGAIFWCIVLGAPLFWIASLLDKKNPN